MECAMLQLTIISWIPLPLGLKPVTSWSVVGSANHSATLSFKYDLKASNGDKRDTWKRMKNNVMTEQKL